MMRALNVRLLLLLGLSPLFVPPAAAQWHHLGLSGPFLRGLKLHDGYLYAANDHGLYRKPAASADTAWTLLGFAGRTVGAFEVVSRDTLVAAVHVYEDDRRDHQEVYRSVDGGASWSPVATHLRQDAPGEFFGAIRRVPGRTDTLYAAGAAALSRSADGGTTWQLVNGEWGGFGMGVHFIAFDPLRRNIVWSGGESAIMWPFLLKSTDGGDAWAFLPLDLGGDNAIYAMAIDGTDPDVLYIGAEAHVLKSTDGGAHWEAILSPPTQEYFFGLAVSGHDPERIYATGMRNALDQRMTLYVSDDAGATWDTLAFGAERRLWFGVEHLALASGAGRDTLYLGTRYDGVYAYTAAASTGADEGPPLPGGYVLEQNYPNPFNPVTRIRFTVAAAAHVRLAVYDALGREVARLVDGALPAGLHQAEWRAEGLPSGTYLYRLEAGSATTVRRMVLLK